MSDPDLDLIQQTHDAHAALMARINGFLDEVDGDVAAAISLAQAQLGTRQAAYDALAADLTGIVDDKLTQRIYINAVDGDDNADGLTQQNAIQTLGKAAEKVVPGASAQFYITRDVHNIGPNVAFFNNRIWMGGYASTANPANTRPTLIPTVQDTNPVFDTVYPISLYNTALELGSVDMQTPILSRPELFAHGAYGVVRMWAGSSVTTTHCFGVVGDWPLVRAHSQHGVWVMAHTHFSRDANAINSTPSHAFSFSTGVLTDAGVISVPSGETWDDYLSITRNSSGHPRNLLSNVNL